MVITLKQIRFFQPKGVNITFDEFYALPRHLTALDHNRQNKKPYIPRGQYTSQDIGYALVTYGKLPEDNIIPITQVILPLPNEERE